jgi:hypothetical protein
MRTHLGIALVVLGIISLQGCSQSDGPATYPVTGSVTMGGKPIEKGSIVFDPADGQGTSAMGGIENGQFTAEVPPGEKILRINAVRTTDEKRAVDLIGGGMWGKLPACRRCLCSICYLASVAHFASWKLTPRFRKLEAYATTFRKLEAYATIKSQAGSLRHDLFRPPLPPRHAGGSLVQEHRRRPTGFIRRNADPMGTEAVGELVRRRLAGRDPNRLVDAPVDMDRN